MIAFVKSCKQKSRLTAAALYINSNTSLNEYVC